MAKVDQIRNHVIDKLLTIENEKLLQTFNEIVDSAVAESERVVLTNQQKTMLKMSKKDIAENNLIAQEDLDRKDRKWLNG